MIGVVPLKRPKNVESRFWAKREQWSTAPVILTPHELGLGPFHGPISGLGIFEGQRENLEDLQVFGQVLSLATWQLQSTSATRTSVSP